MKNSYYQKWRRKNLNAKNYPLSRVFPVSVRKGEWGMAMILEFQNEEGERVTFHLSEEDTAIVRMNIDRFVLGRTDVKREDYGLPVNP